MRRCSEPPFIDISPLAGFGPEPLLPQEENPFPWMSEMIDMKEERNFFETRVPSTRPAAR